MSTRRTLDALELRGGVYMRAADVHEDDVIITLDAADLEVMTVGRNEMGDVVIRVRGDTFLRLERPDDYVCVVRKGRHVCVVRKGRQ